MKTFKKSYIYYVQFLKCNNFVASVFYVAVN